MHVVEDSIIDRLLQLAPFEGPEQARRVFTVTVSALRDLLMEDEANWLGEELGPLPLRRRRQRVEAPSPDALYRRVALYAGVRPSVAREHAQLVCRALAEAVPDAVHRLQRALPPLADLFAIPGPASLPVVPHRLRDRVSQDHTLAGGRPGSTRPIHDARPQDSDGTSPPTRREGPAASRETRSDGGAHPKRHPAPARPAVVVKRRMRSHASASARHAAPLPPGPPQPTSETSGRGFTDPELVDDVDDDVERG
jgi:uncharacterized protein (DUF2267 family)